MIDSPHALYVVYRRAFDTLSLTNIKKDDQLASQPASQPASSQLNRPRSTSRSSNLHCTRLPASSHPAKSPAKHLAKLNLTLYTASYSVKMAAG